jgi:hypothetical protein
MRMLTTTVLISALALGACGTIYGSVVNPVNWFGKGRSSNSAAEQSSNTNPLIQETKRGRPKQRPRGCLSWKANRSSDQSGHRTHSSWCRYPRDGPDRSSRLIPRTTHSIDRGRNTDQRCSKLSLGRCAPSDQRKRRLNIHAHRRCGTCFDGSRAGRGA